MFRRWWHKFKQWIRGYRWYHWILSIPLAVGVTFVAPICVGLAAMNGPTVSNPRWGPQANLGLGILYFSIGTFFWFFAQEVVWVASWKKCLDFVRDFLNHLRGGGVGIAS